MSLLKIRLFGDFSAVDREGNSLSVGSGTTKALVIWLALHLRRDAPLSHFAAITLGADAERGLRGLISDLRYAFRFRPVLLIGEGESTRFDPDLVEVDAVRFEEIASTGAIQSVREATELYRGNLLEGFSTGLRRFDEWIADERLRYWRIALPIFGKLLSAQIHAGWWEAATDTAGRLLALDPSQEVVHRTLMRLQLEQGKPDAALRRYHECAEMLRRQFGRAPETDTEKLRIEIEASLEKTPAPAEIARPNGGPKLILVVEDDLVSLALLEGFLDDAGYDVVAVTDSTDALLELGKRQFDLLVLDINLPTLSGLRLFEIMIEKGIDTPAIFVTAKGGADVEARSLELGAADFLRKPLHKETLLARVAAALQRRGRSRNRA
jgi:CheY-like chemotaxis protein